MIREMMYFVLRGLAKENRRIFSPYRVYLQLKNHPNPDAVEYSARVLKRLGSDGLIKQVAGSGQKSIYQVILPYVSLDVNIHEVVAEAYYTAIFSYSTALELHQLTDQRSKHLHVYLPPSQEGKVLRVSGDADLELVKLTIPLDSKPGDWRLIELPPQSHIKKCGEFVVESHKIKTDWLFGFEIFEKGGVPLRRTDLERTLVDGLRFPKHCGGLNEVFRAWVRALDLVSVDKLIEYTERLGQIILLQRVGFVMEILDLHHANLAKWKAKAQRGGSRRLDPEGDYLPTYSEEWQISLNHPIDILETRDIISS